MARSGRLDGMYRASRLQVGSDPAAPCTAPSFRIAPDGCRTSASSLTWDGLPWDGKTDKNAPARPEEFEFLPPVLIPSSSTLRVFFHLSPFSSFISCSISHTR